MSNTTDGNKVVRKIRMRAIAFLVFALVAGGIAVFLVKGYMDRARAAAARPAIDIVTVVVTTMDLPIATTLAPEHVVLVHWPANHLPEGVFYDTKDVLGHSISESMFAGEPVFQLRLIDPENGRGLAALLPPGKRAMAIKVNQVVGVAGFVNPGDFVDVLVTVSPDEETSKALGREMKIPRLSKIILQNMKVLAVGQHLATDGRKPVPVPVVTLEVDVQQAERLALATQYGKIQLTMRSRLDTEPVETEGITPYALLTPEESPELLAAQVRIAVPVPDVKVSTRRSSRSSSSSRRSSRSSSTKPPPEVVKPVAPVVEILRAGKREERKLRPSADSE
jgi:pilus assembly protein CpaB